MPGDSTVVGAGALDEVVRRIIAEVLVVALAEVQPGKALVQDLGAESIDFLDLVFKLEDALGLSIPMQHWHDFVRCRFTGEDLAIAITPETIRQFAEQELAAQ
jgi:acyl carrier protein